MYGLMMSAREFSSDELEEDMVALNLRTAPDRNRSKQKHNEKRYTNIGQSGGYIGECLTTK
jgi:hypothetical protein